MNGEDDFFTPPWTFYVVLKCSEGLDSITNMTLFPGIVMCIENVSVEYGPGGKHIEGILGH